MKAFWFLIFLWSLPCISSFAQVQMPSDTLQIHRKAGTKGFVIGGASGLVIGGSFGLVTSWISESNQHFSYPATYGLSVAVPSALVGFGIDQIFRKTPSRLTGSPAVTIGFSSAEQLFFYKTDADYSPGIQLGLLSPKLSHWRYHLVFEHYFSFEKEIEQIVITKSAIYGFNLNLHYVFEGNRWEVYPFVGSALFYERQNNRFPDGTFSKYNTSKTAAILGIGVSADVWKHHAIFAEPKWRIDHRYSTFMYTVGVRIGI